MFEPAHILISRTDNIGDVVLTLPIASYLKQRYPALKIGFLCRSYAAPVVRCCEAIDYVIESDKLDDPAAYFAQSGIDTILFSKPDRKLAAAAKKARIAHRIGTSHKLYNWLYCNHLVHFTRVKSDLHEAQLNFKLLQPMGLGFMPTLAAIPPLYRLRAPAMPAVRSVLRQDQFNLILHVKSNGNAREWPITHFTELARLLGADPDVRVWLTGSASEGAWVDAHAAELVQMPHVTNVCGHFTLDALTAFIDAADGIVVGSTGPAHMAAALGSRTLGLYPPRRPMHPGRWAPLGTRVQVLCQAAECDGCKDAATCSCMTQITPAMVLQVIQNWRRDDAARTALDPIR